MNKTNTGEGFVDAHAVAAYLRVTLSTVYILAKKGDIPSYRFGAAWRFRLGEIDRYLFGDWMREYGRY